MGSNPVLRIYNYYEEQLEMNILSKLKSIYIHSKLCSFITYIVGEYPDIYLSSFFRRAYWKLLLKKCGPNFVIRARAIIFSPDLVEIGSDVAIGPGTNIVANSSRGIYIGDDVMISKQVSLQGVNHGIEDLTMPMRKQGLKSLVVNYNNREYSIVIENDVWIGAGAILLSGTKIGSGSVISAGAVVSGDIPPYSVMVGNPARCMFNRKEKYGSLVKS
ncbi:MAG: acyltransferase [Elusimicrobiota bacterium]